MFTDSLTFQMYCKDEEVLHNEKKKIEQMLILIFYNESLGRTHRVSAISLFLIDAMSSGNTF